MAATRMTSRSEKPDTETSARALSTNGLRALKTLAGHVERDVGDEVRSAIQRELTARVLELGTWVVARAAGLVGERAPASWEDLRTLSTEISEDPRLFRQESEGPLFEHPVAYAMGISADSFAEAFATMAPSDVRTVDGAVAVESLGGLYEEIVGWELVRGADGALVFAPGEARRRAGAHFTSRAVTQPLVERTLLAIVPRDPLELVVCDPAAGSGAFLIEVCRFLGARLCERSPRTTERAALRRAAEHAVVGVDDDPRAIALARLSLRLLAGVSRVGADWPKGALVCGDALIGLIASPSTFATRAACDAAFVAKHPGMASELASRAIVPVHWALTFPRAMARGGFDAMVGNPPWVSYAGRAAQPLEPTKRSYYLTEYEAFAGYRNLQSLFVERAVKLVRPGGRIGFVLPTSMSDLGGYEPSRRAHDKLALCDDALPDLEGGGFEGVFQPCMALLSTRRAVPEVIDKTGVWPLERSDLDEVSADLLARLAALPVLPAALFGERGFQSSSTDVASFAAQPAGSRDTPLRVGGDVAPFERKSPSLYCDPALLGGRLRGDDAYREVAFLLRQTARYPMAQLSDGLAFRNSVLAGFSDQAFDAAFLVAYLNASPVRWYHYTKHRDARQGMPQLKIGHLRALPAVATDTKRAADVRAMGVALGNANRGITPDEQAALDEAVADLLDLPASARETITAWWRAHAR